MNLFEPRTYRSQFNTKRFKGFEVNYLETDLWIGIDPASFKSEMIGIAESRIKELRNKLDNYILSESFFKKSLKPFTPAETAPPEAIEMAKKAELAGIGPMSTVAGLFAREIGKEIIQNFSVKELVIENGGDIYTVLKDELILSVFAGESILSERIGLIIPPGKENLGICTSAGTVGPSLSYGKADAVVVTCQDVVIADAYATALGNKVKSPNDIEKVIKQADKYPEILSLLIICEDKIGIQGEFEMRILK